MRLFNIVVVFALASSAAACTVSPGVDSAGPEVDPPATTSEINANEPAEDPFARPANERFDHEQAATSDVYDQIFARQRAARVSESAHVD